MPKQKQPKLPLPEAFHHVLYEVKMLVGVPSLMSKIPSGLHFNTVLEDVLLHARNLDEFFQPGLSGNGMMAENFVTPWVPPSDAERPSAARLNNEIVHIGWERKSPLAPDKEWPLPAIIEALTKTAKRFLAEAVQRDKTLLGFHDNQRVYDEIMGNPTGPVYRIDKRAMSTTTPITASIYTPSTSSGGGSGIEL